MISFWVMTFLVFMMEMKSYLVIIKTDWIRFQMKNIIIDTGVNLADCSLIIVAEKLGINEIISIDSDYDVYRTLKREALNNLLYNYPLEQGIFLVVWVFTQKVSSNTDNELYLSYHYYPTHFDL